MKNSSLLRCLWRAFLLVPVAQSSQLLGQCPNIPAQVNVCEDDPVSISCTSCATLVWVGDDPNDISAAALGDAGDYTFSGTCPAGMGPATFNNRKVRLIVQDRPTVNNISDNAPICDGQTLQLNASGQIPGGSQWLWRDPNNVQVGSTQNITVPNAASGTYRVTVTGPGSLGCSTEAEVNITVNGLPNADISTDPPSGQVCQGENFSLAASGGNDYSWSGPNGLSNSGQTWDNLSQGGTYRVTVTDGNNCTSVAAQDFTVNPLPPLPTITVSKQPACSNQDLTFFSTAGLDNSFAWEGPDGWFSDEQQPVRLNMPLDGDGEYTLIITNPNGCTNSANIYVTVVESPEMNIFPYPDPLCVGQDLYINTDGSPYSEIKDWAWQFPNGFDWDDGDPVLPNISLADAGEYALTVTSWNGCTDTDSKYVDVREGPQAVASANSTSPNIGSTLELSETGPNSGFDVAWLWRGPNGFTSASQNPILTNLAPTASGLYLVIVTDDSGCPPDTAFIQISIPNSPGCTLADASVQPQNPPCFGQSTGMATVNFTGGQAPFSFVWKNGAGVTVGTTQSITGLSAGGYFVTVTDVGGCSVAATTNISQAPPVPPTNILQTICAGQSLNFCGVDRTQSGIFTCNLASTNGCDSLVTLNLQVLPNIQTATFQTICTGQSLNFCGIDQNQPGIYTCNLTATGGCDSVVTLNLQVLPSIQTSISQTICNGQSVNFCGIDRDQTGTFTCNLTATGGCDSVVTLNLQVLPSIQTNISRTICAGQSVNFCGIDRAQTGIFTCNLTATGGCDSVVTLNLQVLPSIQTSISQTICAGQSINFCGTDRDQSGTFTCNLTALGGCDSVVTLNLQVLPSIQTSISQTICAGQSINFCGIDRDQSGIYSCNLTAAGGCDSVVTLNLQVLPSIQTNISQTICAGNSVNFCGTDQDQSGTFTCNLTAAGGCDSVVTLNLQVLPSLQTTISQTICAGNSVNFCGTDQAQSGTFTCNLTAAGGCDSVVTLNLQVLPAPTASVFSETVCAGGCVVFGGLPRCTTGAFLDTLRSAAGCDSLYQILNLTVLPLPVSRDTVRICAGEATIFCGQKIYNAGTFDCTFQTPNGCDSLVQRTVEVRPRPVLAARDDTATLPPGVPELPINVSENDTPPADGTWFLTIVRQPVSGTVGQDTSGGLLFLRQDEQFSGPDSVLYALCSGVCAEVCDSAWVLLFVQNSSLDDLENGIHNVITPGGSPGQNDVFDPVGYLLAQDFAVDFAELSVFNRWGELLFFEKGDRPTWDGREAGGRIVPQATYYFALQTETGLEKRVFKGPLTVLR